MSGLKSILRNAAFAAALAIGVGLSAAQAATLYISEFPTAVSQIGSTTAQVYPQPALVDQTVAITGNSAQSAAFGATTHAIQIECDADCSVAIGPNPTATTTNYLMGDGTPYRFAVIPGQKIAVIANTSGGSGTDINIAAVGGTPVTSPLPVLLSGGSSLVGTVGIDQTTTGTTNGVTSVTSAASTTGLVSISSSAAESNHVIKASPGNLYGFEVATGGTAGFVFVSNTTTAPAASGAAIAPVKCYQVAANSTLGVSYVPNPIQLSTGITIVFSTTGCFVNTASATVFISGDAK